MRVIILLSLLFAAFVAASPALADGSGITPVYSSSFSIREGELYQEIARSEESNDHPPGANYLLLLGEELQKTREQIREAMGKEYPHRVHLIRLRDEYYKRYRLSLKFRLEKETLMDELEIEGKPKNSAVRLLYVYLRDGAEYDGLTAESDWMWVRQLHEDLGWLPPAPP